MVPHAFLQYAIYVGDLNKRPLPTDQQQTIIDEEATRLGSRALFYSPLLSLIASLVLTVFVAEAEEHRLYKPAFIMVDLSSAERNTRTLGSNMGYKSVGICGLYVFCNCVCYIPFNYSVWFIGCLLYSFTSTVWVPHFYHHCYGIFRGLLLNGLHSPWLVSIALSYA